MTPLSAASGRRRWVFCTPGLHVYCWVSIQLSVLIIFRCVRLSGVLNNSHKSIKNVIMNSLRSLLVTVDLLGVLAWRKRTPASRITGCISSIFYHLKLCLSWKMVIIMTLLCSLWIFHPKHVRKTLDIYFQLKSLLMDRGSLMINQLILPKRRNPGATFTAHPPWPAPNEALRTSMG